MLRQTIKVYIHVHLHVHKSFQLCLICLTMFDKKKYEQFKSCEHALNEIYKY